MDRFDDISLIRQDKWSLYNCVHFTLLKIQKYLLYIWIYIFERTKSHPNKRFSEIHPF